MGQESLHENQKMRSRIQNNHSVESLDQKSPQKQKSR
jgi:hypothetical protein